MKSTSRLREPVPAPPALGPPRRRLATETGRRMLAEALDALDPLENHEFLDELTQDERALADQAFRMAAAVLRRRLTHARE